MSLVATALPYVQIALALALIGGVLLQRSDAGLGSAFGADAFSQTHYERRGAEKTLFRLTIVIAVLFVVSALAGLLIA
jgi:preprotein translocase subunit SecG